MEFGKLTDVDLRRVWPHEALNFTPWLSENLERLSVALNIDPPLEPVDTEVAVGPYLVDIVARAPGDGGIALIENQLEASDHTHLGQILTYLAGTKAKIVVWVARDFNDEHLSAVRWLNDHTETEFAFFAVKVRVVQISDSPLVPVFDVPERPSEWERTIRSSVAREESELTWFRRDFWAHYAERYPDEGIPAGNAQSWFRVEIESTKFNLVPYVAWGRVGVSVRGRLDESLDEVRERIRPWEQSLRDEMSVEIVEAISWGGLTYPELWMDTRNRDNWLEMVDWLHKTITDFSRVLKSAPSRATATLEAGDE